MIFRCLSDRPVSPRIANPFELEAESRERCEAILIDWLGWKVAARVTIVPVIDIEPVYEEGKPCSKR